MRVSFSTGNVVVSNHWHQNTHNNKCKELIRDEVDEVDEGLIGRGELKLGDTRPSSEHWLIRLQAYHAKRPSVQAMQDWLFIRDELTSWPYLPTGYSTTLLLNLDTQGHNILFVRLWATWSAKASLLTVPSLGWCRFDCVDPTPLAMILTRT